MLVDLEKLEVGDVIYECEYGQCLQVEIETKPALEHGQWTWKGKVLNARPRTIDYLVTAGMEHYGPKLYYEPPYL